MTAPAFPITRRAFWRLRRALADYRVAKLESKLAVARVKLWHIDRQEPPA